MKHLLLPIIGLAAFLVSAPVSAAPLCIPGTLAAYSGLAEGCSIDNLVFSNFGYVVVPLLGNPNPVRAREVTVTPILEPGRPGLSFAGNWTATNAIIDHLIFYEVSTASGQATISDAYLDWSFSRRGFSVASLDEFLCLGGSLTAGCVGDPFVRFFLRDSPVPSASSDHISFEPVARVGVLKDVFVLGLFGSATISRADNQWGQVPEPASILLISGGLLTLSLGYRRRQKL